MRRHRADRDISHLIFLRVPRVDKSRCFTLHTVGAHVWYVRADEALLFFTVSFLFLPIYCCLSPSLLFSLSLLLIAYYLITCSHSRLFSPVPTVNSSCLQFCFIETRLLSALSFLVDSRLIAPTDTLRAPSAVGSVLFMQNKEIVTKGGIWTHGTNSTIKTFEGSTTNRPPGRPGRVS